LDCGEGIPEYLSLLEKTLPSIRSDAYISDIIISHGHADHWGGLSGILSSKILNSKRQIKVHKFPVPPQCHVEHMDGFPMDITVHELKDKQLFEAEDVTLRAIYSPGHCKDHCTFWLEQENNLFTADCVLGQGTAVFDNLSEYIKGLEYLATLNPTQLYPGHGPVIEKGVDKIKEYIRHRMDREHQIMALMTNGERTEWSPMDITEVLYKAYPENLHIPAARSIVLHLGKLQVDGKVQTKETYPLVPENVVKILNAKYYLTPKNNL
jgi:glyoxylase-like metal-dependent hydrolase (beta-lactamase superfamily II)